MSYSDRAPTGPVGDTFLGREDSPGTATGVLLDGGVYPLDGQPPTARTNGWGDLSWRLSPFYNRTGGVPVANVE
jgi:hypothetical protein